MKRKRPAQLDYTKRTSQEQAKAGMAERDMRADRLVSDMDALKAVQASRPAKPPGRR